MSQAPALQRAQIRLGSAELPLRDLSKLRDSLLLLDRAAGEAVDLVAEDCVIARGQLMSLDGELCVRIDEVLR